MTIPVSAVLPVYNRAAVIGRAIDSVLKQKPGLFTVSELVVVDDGSTDGTAAFVEGLRDPRVKLFRQEKNRGACYARNRGISLASNEFVAFQDSDDVWREDRLSVLGGAFRQDIGVYFSAFYKVLDGTKEFYPAWLKKKEYRAGELVRHSLARNPLSTATLLARKKVVQEAGGFDERLRRFQDWEIVLRIFSRYGVVFVNQPLVTVEVMADSISRNYRAGILSRSYIMKKHVRLFVRYPFLLLRFLAGILVRAALIPFRTAVLP
jgi:glycosyltransferase involved in cell wall biosynthesis